MRGIERRLFMLEGKHAPPPPPFNIVLLGPDDPEPAITPPPGYTGVTSIRMVFVEPKNGRTERD